MWIASAFLFYLSLNFVKANVDYLQHPVKSCHIGDVVENECNRCLCTSKTVFECSAVDCNKNKSYKEIETSRQLCYPNQLYVQNLITCICTKDGRWPHKSCHETFLSLPPSNVVKHKCQPNSYVVIDCNVCRCGPDGEIISDRCTRNACEEDSQRRINLGPNSVYSSCEVKNWYSLAPCQFCFCVNQNKLVCNTGNYYSKKLEIGSYNLRVCGKDLIREAIELIPDSQRVLRYGYPKSNATTATIKVLPTTTAPTTKTPAKIHESHNFAIEVNRESNENVTHPKLIKLDDNSSSDKEEYYSDSEEEVLGASRPKVQMTPSTTTIQPIKPSVPEQSEASEPKSASTKFPFEEGDEMLNESKMGTEEDNEEDSNEVVAEPDLNGPTPSPTTPRAAEDYSLHSINDDQQLNEAQQLAREGKSGESYQYVGNTLKINLPKVLNKVFQMALRKSMVSLSNESKCVPGTTTLSNCNMCFCLKNSKLLCTNNNCKDKPE